MELATWTYYQNDYYGDVITSESLFNKYQSKAVDKLQRMCFGNITDEAVTEYSDQLSKAACAVADILYKLDQAESNAHDPQKGNIKSMSSGSESVSFGENDTVISSALSDKKQQNILIRQAADEYLFDTGLLYAGA